MRLLVLTQYYAPEVGAAQTRLGALARQLVLRGDEVEVITALPNYPKGRTFEGYRGRVVHTEMIDGATVRRVWTYPAIGTGVRRLANYLSFVVTCVIGLLQARKPDIVFVESPPLFTAVPGIVYARLRRVPVVLNVADMWPDAAVAVGALGEGRTLQLALALERWAYREADLVTTVTPGFHDELTGSKGVPASKIVMLANGADTDLFRPDAGDEQMREQLDLPDGPFLVYPGTMGLAHGLDGLVEAMAMLRDDEDAPFLLMIGAGTDRARIEARVTELGLRNVVFRDAIPVRDLARLLPLAEAAVVTLSNIPFFEHTRPAKLFPLMAAGLPVIHAGGGQGARDVDEAQGGLVIPNRGPAIAEAIRTLHADPVLREKLGAAGRATVESKWSWRTQIGGWYDAVSALVPTGH